MKTPIRTCIVCKEKQEKKSLLRIICKNDTIQIDSSGNKPGRGAYICKKQDCLNKLNVKTINRAFKTNFDNKNIINLRNDDME